VQREAQGAFVLVLGGDGKIAQKNIETYTAQGTDYIVTGGLNDGDQVVTSGVMKVRPGAPAKIAPPPGAAPQQAPAKQGEQKH
jgi:membrane fusion protein (multidrug efflux system)